MDTKKIKEKFKENMAKKPKWRWVLLPLSPFAIPIAFFVGIGIGIRRILNSDDDDDDDIWDKYADGIDIQDFVKIKENTPVYITFPHGKFMTASIPLQCNGISITSNFCEKKIEAEETYFDTGEKDVYERKLLLCMDCALSRIGFPYITVR